MLLKYAVFFWLVGTTLGASPSAAELIALLAPMAVEHGFQSLINTAKCLVFAGLEATALTFLTFARIRIFQAQRHHARQHGGGQADAGRAPPLRRAGNRAYDHLDWEVKVLDRFSPREFRNAYGCSRGVFDLLLGQIRDEVEDKKQANGMKAELKLAMTLRWLRGASYIDVYMLYGCAPRTFYRTIYRVMTAITRHHSLPLLGAVKELHQSGEKRWLAAVAAGFARYTDGIIAGCIGAIDGVQVEIKKPSAADCHNPTAYVNRKGIFAINVQARRPSCSCLLPRLPRLTSRPSASTRVSQAIADSSGRLTWASIRVPGSTYDANAFDLSTLACLIAKLGLLGFYLVGDSAYRNSETMLCPIPADIARSGTDEDAFN